MVAPPFPGRLVARVNVLMSERVLETLNWLAARV